MTQGQDVRSIGLLSRVFFTKRQERKNEKRTSPSNNFDADGAAVQKKIEKRIRHLVYLLSFKGPKRKKN